jgi:hypothetical protein
MAYQGNGKRGHQYRRQNYRPEMKFPVRVIITRAEFFLNWRAHNRLPASWKAPNCIHAKYNDYAAAII